MQPRGSRKGLATVRLSVHLYGLYEYIWLDVTYTCFLARTDMYALAVVYTRGCAISEKTSVFLSFLTASDYHSSDKGGGPLLPSSVACHTTIKVTGAQKEGAAGFYPHQRNAIVTS